VGRGRVASRQARVNWAMLNDRAFGDSLAPFDGMKGSGLFRRMPRSREPRAPSEVTRSADPLHSRLRLVAFAAMTTFMALSPAWASDRYRWDIKTGADEQASGIHLRSRTTVKALNSLYRPHRGADPKVRAYAVEQTIYEVTGQLLMFRLEEDGDVHLVIQDEETEATLIAEIPDPTEVSSDSPWRARIESTRQLFESQFHPTSSRKDGELREITVIGVGFWDRRHGAEGAADNGIELHPVLFYSSP